MEKLKPCPFCGAKPRAWGAQVMIDGDCPESIGCANDECFVQPATDYLPWGKAVAYWNQRVLAPTAPVTAAFALTFAFALMGICALVVMLVLVLS